jgi:hypothetical protein
VDHLYIINADGTSIRQLTNSQADASPESSWSHGGSMVAFSSGGVIYRVIADGTNLVRLSPPATQYSADYSPDWSPDDSKIVFANGCYWLATSALQVSGSYTRITPRTPYSLESRISWTGRSMSHRGHLTENRLSHMVVTLVVKIPHRVRAISQLKISEMTKSQAGGYRAANASARGCAALRWMARRWRPGCLTA